MGSQRKVRGEFIKYVAFNILGQMAYSCYTLADTFFISVNLGANGLTALNLAFPVFCVLNGIGLMIGMGGGTRYSIARSRGEGDAANRIFTNAVYMVIGFALMFVIGGAFVSDKLVKALGADATVFAMTNTYLKIMLLFAPAFLTNSLLQCFVRNDGSPSLSMIAMIGGSVSNIILDYLFIFPLGMGMLGAILATGLSPVISIAILSQYFIKKKNHFHVTKTCPSPKQGLKIASSGVPPLVTELSSGVVMFLFNYLILHLEGNTGVAAFSVVTVISLVVVAIYTGLSQGIQPIISRNHGTGEAGNVQAILRYAMVTAVLLSGLIYAEIYMNAPQLVMVFNSEKNGLLQTLAESGLKLYFLACPFIGFNIVLATYFTSTERALPAQAISFLRGFLVLLPMAFLLSSLGGMTGVWCTYPLTEAVVAGVGAAFYVLYRRRQGEGPGKTR